MGSDNQTVQHKKPIPKDYPSTETADNISRELKKAVIEFTLFKKHMPLEDFSKNIGYGAKQVSQVINHMHGMSYPVFRNTVQCKKSLEIIKDNPDKYRNANNQDLADLTGYPSASAFSEGMKYAFGLTSKNFMKFFLELVDLPEYKLLSIDELVKKVQDRILLEK